MRLFSKFINFIIKKFSQLESYISKTMSDDGNNPSSIRWLIFLIIATDVFNRIFMVIKHSQYIAFNWTDAATFFGIFYAKQLQKGKEITADNRPPLIEEEEKTPKVKE